jgi:hypothetical protein
MIYNKSILYICYSFSNFLKFTMCIYYVLVPGGNMDPTVIKVTVQWGTQTSVMRKEGLCRGGNLELSPQGQAEANRNPGKFNQGYKLKVCPWLLEEVGLWTSP